MLKTGNRKVLAMENGKYIDEDEELVHKSQLAQLEIEDMSDDVFSDEGDVFELSHQSTSAHEKAEGSAQNEELSLHDHDVDEPFMPEERTEEPNEQKNITHQGLQSMSEIAMHPETIINDQMTRSGIEKNDLISDKEGSVSDAESLSGKSKVQLAPATEQETKSQLKTAGIPESTNSLESIDQQKENRMGFEPESEQIRSEESERQQNYTDVKTAECVDDQKGGYAVLRKELNEKYRKNVLNDSDIDRYIGAVEKSINDAGLSGRMEYIIRSFTDRDHPGDAAKCFIELKRLYRDSVQIINNKKGSVLNYE